MAAKYFEHMLANRSVVFYASTERSIFALKHQFRDSTVFHLIRIHKEKLTQVTQMRDWELRLYSV